MFLKFCNLCSFPIIKVNRTVFGTRCINCLSTYAHRALGYYFIQQSIEADAIIHEFSNHGAFLRFLKKKYRNVSTSEYFEDVKSGDYQNDIQCQDVQNLSFIDESIDVFTSTEVFEHVPDDIKAFNEIYRCLKPKGHYIFTVPLDINMYNTVVRATIVNGEIVHILPPEYHGDHLRSQGILSFRTYGMDIEKTLLDIGFSYAKVNVIFETKLAMGRPMPVIHCIK